MTIGIFQGHAFLIKGIKKLANQYLCGQCNARFTIASNLSRHADRCQQGQTEIVCRGEQVEARASAFEKTFYSSGLTSFSSIQWLESEARARKTHIHHALCVHGGERWISGAPVDGYDPSSKTVFQFNGCHWHGCETCFPHPKRRRERVRKDNMGNIITREMTYQRLHHEAKIRDAGYNLVVRWDHEPKPWRDDPIPEKQTVTFAHTIVFDFEGFQNKTCARKPTNDLTFESEHVSISVSIATLSIASQSTAAIGIQKFLLQTLSTLLSAVQSPFTKTFDSVFFLRTKSCFSRNNSAQSKNGMIRSPFWGSTLVFMTSIS